MIFNNFRTDNIKISLAKNEWESFQVVVKANKDLHNVKIIPGFLPGGIVCAS